MKKEIELAVIPEKLGDEKHIKELSSQKTGVQLSRIQGFVIRKRSIDARGKQVLYRIKVDVYIDEEVPRETLDYTFNTVKNAVPVIIIGAGSAGWCAALRSIEKGLKPILLERGKDVQARRRDLAKLNKEGIVNSESNYCFGEGGAGTYSDGKLYTRSNKRGDVQEVLKWLVRFGATPDIMVDARPHIGTNKLPHIIKAIREAIIEAGGEVHFDTKVVDILESFGIVRGVVLENGEKIQADHVISATSYSERDIYELFHKKNWLMEDKPFALGVRIEHPQYIIDQSQYHCESRGDFLPPAYYSLVEQVNNRG